MHIRDPQPPDEPDDDGGADEAVAADEAPELRAASVAEHREAPTSARFAVPVRVIAAKFAVVGALLALTLVFAVREQIAVGVAATLGAAVFAARDVLARERLRADANGVVAVREYAGRARLDWSAVERMVVDSRLRFGARAQTLELDAGDQIFLFSRSELGTDPEEALGTLEAIRGDR